MHCVQKILNTMLKANLLPLNEQKLVQQEQIRRVIWFFSIMLSCSIAIAIVLLFPSYLTVLYHEQEVADSLEIEKNVFQKLSLQDALTEVKNLKLSIVTIQGGLAHASSSQLLSTLLDYGGGKVLIQSINVQSDGSISMNGRAPTRDDLLSFEEALKNSGKLQKITVPLDNIVKDTDIAFTVQAQIQK